MFFFNEYLQQLYQKIKKKIKSFDFGTKPSCVFNVAQGPEFKHKKYNKKPKYSIVQATATTTTINENNKSNKKNKKGLCLVKL